MSMVGASRKSSLRSALASVSGKKVFLTGHTGFKGGWLTLWLNRWGAQVFGYALAPPTDPSMFEVAGVGSVLAADVRADVEDFEALLHAMEAAQPEVVFHLAAQSLVRIGYREPLTTFRTNVIGIANVLEAARRCPSIKAIVIVTSDKVYHNREWVHPYREGDELGGHDPYSASKAAGEIVTASFRAAFFDETESGPRARIATARAGNVLGGGDWAVDRLVPDCLRAFDQEEAVTLRFPNAMRPWQHVLEPLAGYLTLASALLKEDGGAFASAWNFGPDESSNATVGEVAEWVARIWGEGARVEKRPSRHHPHEAGLLCLESSRARTLLDWSPRWHLDETLHRTVGWHRAWREGTNMHDFSMSQIAAYEGS